MKMEDEVTRVKINMTYDEAERLRNDIRDAREAFYDVNAYQAPYPKLSATIDRLYDLLDEYINT